MTLKMKLYQFLFLFRVIGICYSLPQTLRQLPQPSEDIFNEHPLSETTKINNQLVELTTSEHQKLIHSPTGNIFCHLKTPSRNYLQLLQRETKMGRMPVQFLLIHLMPFIRRFQPNVLTFPLPNPIFQEWPFRLLLACGSLASA
jgi:hypothetical protein